MFASQPDLVWRLQDRPRRNRPNGHQNRPDERLCALSDRRNLPDEAGVVASVNAAIADADMVLPDNTPPMCAGLYGYFGYECVRLAEPRVPDSNRDVLGVPDSVLFRPQLVAVLDNLKGLLSLYVVVRPKRASTPNRPMPRVLTAYSGRLTTLVHLWALTINQAHFRACPIRSAI